MLQIYKLYFNLDTSLLNFLAFLTPITKKNSLVADFPHLLEAISIILTSVVIFLSCLPLCYSGPPFSLSNARRFCRRDNHRSLWFSSGLFSRMLRHCRCPLSCARRFHRRVSLLSRVLIITTKRHALLHTPLPPASSASASARYKLRFNHIMYNTDIVIVITQYIFDIMKCAYNKY